MKSVTLSLHAQAAVAGLAGVTRREGLTFGNKVAAEGENSRVPARTQVSPRQSGLATKSRGVLEANRTFAAHQGGPILAPIAVGSILTLSCEEEGRAEGRPWVPSDPPRKSKTEGRKGASPVARNGISHLHGHWSPLLMVKN